MKIALAQQNYHIGNFEQNARKIIDAIIWAKAEGADLVVKVFAPGGAWLETSPILFNAPAEATVVS